MYIESNLEFVFDDRWQVLKYDDHPYYRILSGRSFSGIDFAGIFENEQLYLIEVKNFFQFENKGKIENIEEFVLEIKEKILDSVDLIRIIQKFHQRKWTYRLFAKLVMRFPSLSRDWWFWTRMHELIQSQSMTFVLLVDSIADNETLQGKLLSSLEGEVYKIPNVLISSANNFKVPGVTILHAP